MNILVTGPESTGKSTISKWIVETYQATLIPEYAREFLEKNGPTYQEEDLYKIATGHYQSYEAVKQESVLVFDTYMLNIMVWATVKYGAFDTRLVSYDSTVEFDLVLLATPDVPWLADPLRENPTDRDELFARFKIELETRAWEYQELVSGKVERQEQVRSILESKPYSLKTKSSI